jgi:cyclic pyranopterin phosphate synthase
MAMSRVHLPVVGPRPDLGAVSGPPLADPLVDTFARRIRYLRISVTDRCNYRCGYCMPEALVDQMAFAPRSAVLTFEELTRIVSVFARLGVRKIRLTGGEPTVRRGIVELVAMVAGVPGIEQVVMTTNGHLLGELAVPLAAAGLSAVNVSLDTLDAERFHAVTGRGELAKVLAGIDAARAAGLTVKTNAVALVGVNDDEIVALCRYAWDRDAVPRFIEHMPMSEGQVYDAAKGVSARQIRDAIETEHGALVADTAGPGGPGIGGASIGSRDAGPARYWRLADGKRVGIISAMTEHFCDDCNRLRLTATGDLHACLGHDDAVSLRDVLRAGGGDDDLVAAVAASVRGKRAGHVFHEAAPKKHMIGIGG